MSVTNLSPNQKTFPQTELPSTSYNTNNAGDGALQMQTLTIKQVPQQAQQIHSLRYRKSLLESQRTTIQPIVGNKSSMIRKDQKTLNTILKRCEKVQNQSQEFIDELKLCQLIDGIKLYEESRLSKQLEDLAETKPHLLRELVHEKHIQRVNKFAEQREVY